MSTVHTSVYTRDLSAAVARVIKANWSLRAAFDNGTLDEHDEFFCRELFKEIQSHVDWHDVRERLNKGRII